MKYLKTKQKRFSFIRQFFSFFCTLEEAYSEKINPCELNRPDPGLKYEILISNCPVIIQQKKIQNEPCHKLNLLAICQSN